MAISFPLSVPAVGGIESVKFTLLDAAGVSESPYTYSQEIYEHPGKRWAIDVQLIPMLRQNAEEWVAFLASLRGRRGTFLLGDPLGKVPRGVATGTPLVKGADQVGQTIVIDGATPSVVNWIRKGDWIQFGTGADSHLHKSLTDANANSGGEVTLELWPGPRSAATDNAAVIVTNTKGVWRLKDNVRAYDEATGKIFGMSFSAVEAL